GGGLASVPRSATLCAVYLGHVSLAPPRWSLLTCDGGVADKAYTTRDAAHSYPKGGGHAQASARSSAGYGRPWARAGLAGATASGGGGALHDRLRGGRDHPDPY